MAFFIAVKTYDLTGVTLFLLFSGVNCNIASDRVFFFDTSVHFYQHLSLFCWSFFLASFAMFLYRRVDFRSFLFHFSRWEKPLAVFS